MDRPNNGRPTTDHKVSTDKARQGKRGSPVLIVLIAALVLVAIAWFAAEMFGQSIDPQPDNAVAPSTQTEPAGNSGVNN
jgi:flagellar basal body-associated protein FliL